MLKTKSKRAWLLARVTERLGTESKVLKEGATTSGGDV